MANVPTNKRLYNQIKEKIKARYSTWPSAYASAALVQEYKAAGGKYRSMARGGLTKWFGEKWVDLSRPKAGGGYEDCGRDEAKGAATACSTATTSNPASGPLIAAAPVAWPANGTAHCRRC